MGAELIDAVRARVPDIKLDVHLTRVYREVVVRTAPGWTPLLAGRVRRVGRPGSWSTTAWCGYRNTRTCRTADRSRSALWPTGSRGRPGGCVPAPGWRAAPTRWYSWPQRRCPTCSSARGRGDGAEFREGHVAAGRSARTRCSTTKSPLPTTACATSRWRPRRSTARARRAGVTCYSTGRIQGLPVRCRHGRGLRPKQSTGSASRDYSRQPSPGTSNIELGRHRQARRGHRRHQGRAGRLRVHRRRPVEHAGRRRHPERIAGLQGRERRLVGLVKDAMIAGNVYEMFGASRRSATPCRTSAHSSCRSCASRGQGRGRGLSR